MLKKIISNLLIIIYLLSCNNKNNNSYSKINKNIFYKLISFDEVSKTCVNKDYVLLKILLKDTKGKILYKNSKTGKDSLLHIKISDCIYSKNIFQNLNINDSLSFIFTNVNNWQCFPFYKKDSLPDTLYCNIKIVAIYDSASYSKLIDNYFTFLEIKEQKKLKNYLKEKNINIKDNKKGVWIIKEKQGNNKKIDYGDWIEIHFKGFFLNGEEFTSTYNLDYPFDFRYGDPGQVIKGIEIALSYMHEGEKSIIIIPSQLAFGSNGSSNGIIPPFTTVVYELKLVKIIKNAKKIKKKRNIKKAIIINM